MNLQPAKVLSGVWQGFLAMRQEERERNWLKKQDELERKRIERADKIKHALIVLEAARNRRIQGSESQA